MTRKGGPLGLSFFDCVIQEENRAKREEIQEKFIFLALAQRREIKYNI